MPVLRLKFGDPTETWFYIDPEMSQIVAQVVDGCGARSAPVTVAGVSGGRASWVGRWDGNTLVIDITNTNGEQWYEQAGDFLSDAAHIVQRWTLIDPDVLHIQSTIDDPKVFTQPMKFSVAWVRLQWACQECKELFEESSFEGDRDLPAMFKTHTRYPGWNGLPAARGK